MHGQGTDTGGLHSRHQAIRLCNKMFSHPGTQTNAGWGRNACHKDGSNLNVSSQIPPYMHSTQLAHADAHSPQAIEVVEPARLLVPAGHDSQTTEAIPPERYVLAGQRH
jgi:hypothetical protein